MAVKTITIREDAYRLLKSVKKPNESFSDVIERLVRTASTKNAWIDAIYGIGGIDEEAIRKIRELNRKWSPPQW